MRVGAGALVGTLARYFLSKLCPNCFYLARSTGMTRLRNCVKGSYACVCVVLSSRVRAGGRGSWYSCVVCRAICSRSLASLMNDQLIDKLC